MQWQDISMCLSDLLDDHTNLSATYSKQVCVRFSSRDTLAPSFVGSTLRKQLVPTQRAKRTVKKSSLHQPFSDEKLLTCNSCDTHQQKSAFLNLLLSTVG